MSKFVKWNDLNQFHEVVKSLGHNRIYQKLVANDFKIKFGLKVKLHGTNAAVRIDPDGKVTAQKRSSDLLGTADNCGFRAWVERNEAFFSNLAILDTTIVIFGEWAGPGVQQGVAVSQIPNKCFFPFAIDYFTDYVETGKHIRAYDPKRIENFLDGKLKACPNDIIVIPWYDAVEIDFVNKLETEKSLVKLNLLTEKVGESDPFIKEIFDVEGNGEGFVCYPMLGNIPGLYMDEELEHFSHFNFKSKSEHHRVNKTKDAVSFDPEKFANKNRFADAFCTEQRFEQGFREFMDESIERTMQKTSGFIAWVCRDVAKESKTEQEETGISWKDLSKVVSSRAAIWFKARIQSLD